MERDAVAKVLNEMADILEIAGANAFEVMAYRNGAINVEDWSGDLEAAAREERLTDIDGVGKGLSRVIGDLVLTGDSPEYARLRTHFPDGVLHMRFVPGLGPKKIRRLWEELNIDGLDALEAAAKAERIRALSGFGAKTEERILIGVERARRRLGSPPS